MGQRLHCTKQNSISIPDTRLSVRLVVRHKIRTMMPSNRGTHAMTWEHLRQELTQFKWYEDNYDSRGSKGVKIAVLARVIDFTKVAELLNFPNPKFHSPSVDGESWTVDFSREDESGRLQLYCELRITEREPDFEFVTYVINSGRGY